MDAGKFGIKGKNFTINSALADATGNELAVLTAEIKDNNFFCMHDTLYQELRCSTRRKKSIIVCLYKVPAFTPVVVH